jgi:hypothetical protein
MQSKDVAKRGGNIAKVARLEYEKEIKQSIISPINAQNKVLLEVERQTPELPDDEE